MKLTRESLKNKDWQEKGFILPKFDIEKITKNTKENSAWIHFGAGNIFRAFPALSMQKLIEDGLSNSGIILVDRTPKPFKRFENLTLAVTLKSNGDILKNIVASMVESTSLQEDSKYILELGKKESLQIISLTITEKGYNSDETSVPSFIELMLYERFLANKTPIAIVSMDNLANNGDILKNLIFERAKFLDAPKEFLQYLEKEVSFPITMIDKITPYPSNEVAKILAKDGYEDIEIIKNVASFVNAEEAQYLIIEDIFPNGKPLLEKAGILFTNRETVKNIEKMKVGACLNPLHTIIAIFGSLLKIDFVYEAMKNKAIVNLIKECGYNESLPFVPDPIIINPKAFLDEVLEKRFPNPFIPDSPKRIATDTSLKIPVRFGEVLKTMQTKKKDISELSAIPFFIAGWFKYLCKIDDEANQLELSPDPNLQELTSIFEYTKLGNELPIDAISLLRRSDIFGINIIALAPKIKTYFDEMNREKGAIQNTLNKYWA